MKNGQPEAQDFTTGELIEALRARNFDVLTAPVHAEITRAQREATRAECAAETEAKLATARAEAALAEREALVFYVDRALRDALGGVFRTAYVLAVADAFRARTTSATLSTETLAAIAEARGLRVVEPGLLATAERERDEARAELASMRADLAALTARVETEIPAACAAVRERTIAQCVAAALTHTIAPGLALSEPNADPTQVALARVVHRTVSAVVDTLRALATPQPAPADSLDVDPAAGALR